MPNTTHRQTGRPFIGTEASCIEGKMNTFVTNFVDHDGLACLRFYTQRMPISPKKGIRGWIELVMVTSLVLCTLHLLIHPIPISIVKQNIFNTSYKALGTFLKPKEHFVC